MMRAGSVCKIRGWACVACPGQGSPLGHVQQTAASLLLWWTYQHLRPGTWPRPITLTYLNYLSSLSWLVWTRHPVRSGLLIQLLNCEWPVYTSEFSEHLDRYDSVGSIIDASNRDRDKSHNYWCQKDHTDSILASLRPLMYHLCIILSTKTLFIAHTTIYTLQIQYDSP